LLIIILKKYLVAISLIAVIAFAYGLATGIYKIFPYELLDDTKKILMSEKNAEQFQVDKFVYETDVDSLIRIEGKEDVITKRNELVEYIWNGNTFPKSKLPQNIEQNIIDSRYLRMENLQKIDKISYEMEYGINSISYLFFPKEGSKNRIIVYHQGHDGDFYNGLNTIEYFVKNGYTVMAFSMPLLGMNSQPVVKTEDFGPIILKSHDHLRYVESDDLKPIKFFFEPIAVSINYLDMNYHFDEYYMVGISGGAWITMYYPALDDRIVQSYSVAGPLPLYLRSNYNIMGDYETELPELIRIANELEAYVMSSYGENRKFVQIYNKYDPCCWSGTLFETYEETVRNKVAELGSGEYDIFLDDSHKEHKISNYALNGILESMEG